MMKLSSRARYGLKAMCYLAEHYGEGVKPLSAMAQETQMSEKYLEQLLAALRKAGLIETARGANGGYVLAMPPDRISVGQVLRVLEDGLVIVDCISEGCCNQGSCATYDVWQKLYAAINGCLDNMSLSGILEK